MFAEGQQYEHQRQFRLAAAAYKKALALDPTHAEAANNLGCVLMMQGHLPEASAAFARSLELAPELFNDFGPICAVLSAILPPLGQAMQAAKTPWPERPLPKDMVAEDRLLPIATDPLLLTILRSSPVRDIALERALTEIRAALLRMAVCGKKVDAKVLTFCAALAEQCFINEYVFPTTSVEEDRVDQLHRTLRDCLIRDPSISPFQVAALAMYNPLHKVRNAARLLEMKWPAAVNRLVTQQIREPQEEIELRATIPALTSIVDEVSARVRQQYEDSPYPRWVHLAGNTAPLSFGAYLSSTVLGALPSIAVSDRLEVLVAGCGTGSHPIELARKLGGSHVLAIDLSLSSLAYAKRKTPGELLSRIEYAQADILRVDGLARSFDVIDATGVLHHMKDPQAGLRVLLSLLRPTGFLRLGLYSEIGRRDILAARQFLSEQGFKPTTQDIRRARQMLLNSDLRKLSDVNDFYTISECRDFLFHVQEHRTNIPQIKTMLQTNHLSFIGFVFHPVLGRQFSQMFSHGGKQLNDLNAWEEFEQSYPATFRSMYQFWCQKLPPDKNMQINFPDL